MPAVKKKKKARKKATGKAPRKSQPKKADPRGATIRDYAAHRKALGLSGASPWSVGKALRDGRISRNRNGRISLAKADREWKKNTNPKRLHGQKPEGASGPSYADSRAKKEGYLAEMARVQLQKELGSLVKADEVEQALFQASRLARDKLLNIPDRLAPLLAPEEDEVVIRGMVEDEIRAALEVLGNARNYSDMP